MQRPHIVGAFEPGARALDPREGEITLRLETLPDALLAPTGRIVACDPLYCVGTSPYTVAVRPGAYPVILCIAQFPELGERPMAEPDQPRLGLPGEQRIAAAMLRVQSEPAVHWELAISQKETEKQGGSAAIETAVEGEASRSDDAYCVDSGFGSFMDKAAIGAFLERSGASSEEDEGAAWDARVEYLFDHMEDEEDQSRGLSRDSVVLRYSIVLNEQSGLNMLLFSSGWGDGTYASYWGLDANGSPVCLITDFGIFEDAEWMQERETPH